MELRVCIHDDKKRGDIVKKLLMVAALVSAPVLAEESNCAGISALSYQVMDSRQAGVSLVTMMDIVKDSGIRELAEAMILEAYQSPRYHTQQVAQRESEDFRDKWTLACLRSIGE